MEKILLFLYYAFITVVVLIGLSSFFWLPMFFLPNLSGFIIGMFVTVVTFVTSILLFD